MLRKVRIAMRNQDFIYSLSGVVELGDAFFGGKKTGKRSRELAGKTSAIVACENNNGCPGFVAMKVIKSVSKKEIEQFTKEHIKPSTTVRTDAYTANNGVSSHAILEKKVTPP